MPKFVIKRDGSKALFDSSKVATAIWKAVQAVGGVDRKRSDVIAEEVVVRINEKYGSDGVPSVEEIQDLVETTLIKGGHDKTAKAYILYRHQRELLRRTEDMVNNFDIVNQYISQEDWRVRENSNMAYSLQGMNFNIAGRVVSNYWLGRVYPKEVAEAHKTAALHIHDLDCLAAYCVGWDLKQLLLEGFTGVRGKVSSKPAKHLRSAFGQIVNFFYTLQGEAAGAQAFSNFDTYLAPFIRYDNLDRKQVKQAIQEFIFNTAVPTRVGFQCMSEDTEILTPLGWFGYSDLKEGDLIKTFNIESGVIEDKPIKRLFAREYNGKMFRLRNRISDQLISPKHRVVRKAFGSNKYILEEIESVKSLKSPFIVPIAGLNNSKGSILSSEEIRLLAWVIAEGSSENPKHKYRQCGRITLYQSEKSNKSKYEEILSLLKGFALKFSIKDSIPAFGFSTKMIRLNAASSREVHNYFQDKYDIKHIPQELFQMNQNQSRLFLETYLKADGHEDCKISTTDKKILDGLQHICVLAGYGCTVSKRKATIGKKDIFVLRLVKHNETYIQRIEEIDYSGTIWCPNTDNETVIARRAGKVFITGNTPFTNITMDLNVPSHIAHDPVIIGGKAMELTYADFQEEMDLFNDVFCEVMTEGDASGRIFTFPIPTYNITSNFDWDSPKYDGIWEMTAKYGIPYFANYVNSDMSPEDARSMCCRLRLDNRVLNKRGGGLFGANPLTGSIGVVTINMPRLGFTSKSESEFFAQLGRLMDLAKESLVIKRKTIERLADQGLYPYAKYYLRGIKEQTGGYWTNHFSTIGLLGMNEALLNFMNKNITTKEGQEFTIKVLDFMRDRLLAYQDETGDLFNLEATPGEGTSRRFAWADKKQFPTIIVANEKQFKEHGVAPYYTNSTQLPVSLSLDLFSALDLQDPLQTRYTGGTVFHVFLGEKLPSKEATKNLVRKISANYHLPYFSLTPTFSVCPIHGYIAGEHEYCPVCEKE
ncbi:MAG: ribonucleoside triphosphate reductase [archaeon]